MYSFFQRTAGRKSKHAHMYSNHKKLSMLTVRNKYIFRRELNDDNETARQTSFEIEFQTEEATENEQSQRATLLCADLLRRGMV